MGRNVITFEPLHPDVEPPVRSTRGSAGYDLRAYLKGRVVRLYRGDTGAPEERQTEGGQIVLEPGDRALVPTGFRARLPNGYEAQLRIRSSVAYRKGLILPNAPGTVDADYPDEWFVLVQNASSRPQRVEHGERIAQAVLHRYETPIWVAGRVSRSTDRVGGLGSTGA